MPPASRVLSVRVSFYPPFSSATVLLPRRSIIGTYDALLNDRCSTAEPQQRRGVGLKIGLAFANLKSASYPAHNSDQPIDNQPRDRNRGERDESIHSASPNFGIGQVLIEILHTGREICDGVCACKKAPVGEAKRICSVKKTPIMAQTTAATIPTRCQP